MASSTVASVLIVLMFAIVASSAASAAAAPAASTLSMSPYMGCSASDIIVYQRQTPHLPNGIPTYTVHIVNECGSSGCKIGHIHLSCGMFSSAILINPRTFRRIGPNDCLVNDGRPIASGEVVAFQYANTFSFPLAVSHARCMGAT